MSKLTLFITVLLIGVSSVFCQNYEKQYFRVQRILTTDSCIPNSNPCQCKAPCFIADNTTQTCTVKDCYSWDENLAECKATGKQSIIALLLQIFLGYLGVGFGYLENWYLFGIYWGVIGGTILLACFSICFCCGITAEDRASNTKGFNVCMGFLLGVFIIVMYIYGIVIIAENQANITSDGCPLV